MEKTLATFTTECQSKALPSPEPVSDSGSQRMFSRRDATSLINCFNTGDLEGFMEVHKYKVSYDIALQQHLHTDFNERYSIMQRSLLVKEIPVTHLLLNRFVLLTLAILVIFRSLDLLKENQ